MQQNLQHCLHLVLESEGGFVDNAADPGGATNHGITIATLAAWRKAPVSADDVKALGETESCMIYRAQYSSPVRFADLPEGLDYAVLDMAVNSGPSHAATLLQGILGVEADGIIGLHTLAALDGKNVVDLIHAYSQARMSFLRSLPTWATFGRGWATRVARVEHDAVEMATGIEHAGKPDLVPEASAKALPVPPAPPPSGWAAIIAAAGAALVALVLGLSKRSHITSRVPFRAIGSALLRRLTERSTVAAILTAIATVTGHALAPELAGYITDGAVAFASAVLFVTKERDPS